MNNIIFHVGLHKTGTTFLQRNVFYNMKNINFFCTDGRQFTGVKDIDKNKINLISNEWYSGDPHVSKDFTRYKIGLDIATKYPDSKVIVVFREKNSWMKSLYSQYIKNGGTYNFERWKRDFFNEKYLDFKGYEKFLQKNFKKVLVLWFEDLRKNPDNFIKSICDFIGIKVPKYDNKIVGKGFSSRQLAFLRILNFFPIKLQKIYYRYDTKKTRKFFENKSKN